MAKSDDGFEAMCRMVEEALDKNGASVRWSRHPDADIACLYGPNASPVHRALQGLEHIEEMSYTAAEHHPHYRILNGVVETARTILENWDGVIESEDADNMKWSISNVMDALNKMK